MRGRWLAWMDFLQRDEVCEYLGPSGHRLCTAEPRQKCVGAPDTGLDHGRPQGAL